MRPLLVAVVALALYLGSMGCSSNKESERKYVAEFPLHSMTMRAESDSSGSFFLIAGGYDEDTERKYWYYAENLDGTIQLNDNKTGDIVIKLIKDGSQPRVVCRDNDKWGKDDRFTHLDGYYKKQFCIFYVPEDSIGNNYDMRVPK